MSPVTVKAARASLGISAKYVHTKRPLQRKKEAVTGIEQKKVRYALQRVAQSLLYDRDALKQHRVCSCSRDLGGDGVNVYRSIDLKSARLAGLMTCGSVWACPICAQKITNKRREELQQAVNTWAGQGGKVLLMTLTFPHARFDNLAGMNEQFGAALKKFKNSRTYKNTFGTEAKPGRYGRIGSVRSLEVTHGVNGWHPHTHDLVFVKHDGFLEDGQSLQALKKEWFFCLHAVGLAAMSELNDVLLHGLDVRGGDYAAEYIAKYGREPQLTEGWGLADELTRSHAKVAAGLHATPFMLLKWAGDGDEEAANLFREFASAYDGKRMNHWSAGLKKRLAIAEEDDDALAAEPVANEPDEEMVIRLDVIQWQAVIKHNARGLLLDAALRGREAVIELLKQLEANPGLYRGWFRDRCVPRIFN